MGATVASTKFLLEARHSGVCFERTLALGRQHLAVGPERLEKLLKQFGCWPSELDPAEFHRAICAAPWRFESFLRFLGGKEIVACDASSYEGANLIHDLNQPIPVQWEQSFDVVIDGGTLEHIFDFPVAISNCMRWLKTGGRLFLFAPANNFFGHGFYQFSPELFYRVLSKENGFRIERMIALVDGEGVSSVFGVKYPFPMRSPWYVVRDPAEIQERVTLLNDRYLMLFVQAKKISAGPLLRQTPQQSDYQDQWSTPKPVDPLAQTAAAGSVVSWLRGHFSETFCREVLPKLAWFLDPFRWRRFRRRHSFRNRRFFTRIR